MHIDDVDIKNNALNFVNTSTTTTSTSSTSSLGATAAFIASNVTAVDIYTTNFLQYSSIILRNDTVF